MPETARPYSVGGIVALIVFGLLLLIPSGLCTGTMGVIAISSALTQPNGSEALAMVPMGLLVGGPFIVGGAALLFTGIQRARANRQDRSGPT